MAPPSPNSRTSRGSGKCPRPPSRLPPAHGYLRSSTTEVQQLKPSGARAGGKYNLRLQPSNADLKCCKKVTTAPGISKVNGPLNNRAAHWQHQITSRAAMSEGAEKLNVPADQNQALCAPAYEILITLRDHSTVMGCRPIILGHKDIQFCSTKSRTAVVLPLDQIWTVERPSFVST
jgi:hypothetical protein